MTVATVPRTVMYFVDSAEFGGAEQSLLHVIAGLDRGRWRPMLLHHPEAGLAPLLARAARLDVPLRSVPRVRWRTAPTAFPGLLRAIAAERPAIFHAQLTWPLACKYGLLAAAAARAPAVIATAHLFIEHVMSLRVRLQQRLIAPAVDRYIAVSRQVAARWEEDLGVPRSKLRVIPNGIPLASYDAGVRADLAAVAPTTTDAGRPVVLTAARLDPQKGLNHLLTAAVELPEALFLIAGDGPERAGLEQEAGHLGLNDRVRFLGYRSDVPALLAECDLFVLPSLFEGLPLAILEAMAAGKPVVASAVGGVPEIIHHGETGLLVPPADPPALAAAIRRVISEPGLGLRLGTAGQVRVQREFSAETMVARVTELYDEVLRGAG